MEIGFSLSPLLSDFIEGKLPQDPAPAEGRFNMFLTELLLPGEEEDITQSGKALKRSPGFLIGPVHQILGCPDVSGLISLFDMQPVDSFTGPSFIPVSKNLTQREEFHSNKNQEILSDSSSLLEGIGIKGLRDETSKAVLQAETVSPEPQPSVIPAPPIPLDQRGVIPSGLSAVRPFTQSSIPFERCDDVRYFPQENEWSGKQEIQSSPPAFNREETILVNSRGVKPDLANIPSHLQMDNRVQGELPHPFIKEGKGEVFRQEEKIMYQSEKSFSNPPPKTDSSGAENRLNHSIFFKNHEKTGPSIHSFSPASEDGGPSIDGDFKGMGKMLLEKDGATVSAKNENQNQEEPSLLFVQTGDQKIYSPRSHGPQNRQEISTKGEYSEIYQQIGKRVVWSIKNNEERIKLTLDPPELGNIYMEINRDRENIKATLWTDHPGTKEILETHQTQLHKILKEDGFELKKFDIFVRQEAGPFEERRDWSMDHGRWLRKEFNDDERSYTLESLKMTSGITDPSIRGSHYLDLFV